MSRRTPMTRLRVARWAVALAYAAATLSGPQAALGATVTWDADTGTGGAQDGSGIWDTSNPNWWTGSANSTWNNATPDSAVFGAGGAGAYTVTLGEAITAGQVTFNAGPAYTLDGLAGATLTLPTAGTIRVESGATVRFDVPLTVVAGGATWNKTGAGTLILTAPSTNTAYVNHSDGVINVRHNNALGTGYEHVFGDGSLELQDNVTVANTLYIGNTTLADPTINFRSVSGNNTWSGTVYIHDTHPYAKVSVDAGSTLTISGRILPRYAAVGAFDKLGAGTLVLRGNNAHNAPTIVSEGTLQLGHANALGLGGWTPGANADTTVAAGAVLDLNGQAGVSEVITLNGAGIAGAGALVNSSATPASVVSGVVHVPVTSGGSGYTAPPSVVFSGGGAGAAASAMLGLTNASVTVTNGGSGYTSAPTVAISGGGGFGATATATVSGGQVTGITITNPGYGYTAAPTFVLTGGGGSGAAAAGNASNFTVTAVQVTAPGSGYTAPPTVTLTGGAGSGATAGAPTLARVVLNTNASIGGAGDIAIAAVISGGGALSKVGDGALVLSGANTYSGRTNVLDGTLRLTGGPNRLNPAGALWVGDTPYTLGPVFELDGADQTFQGWSRVTSGSGVVLGGGATLTLYAADIWGSSTISGNGRFVKTGPGLMTFGAAATHTGGTVINDGRLGFYSSGNHLPATGNVEVSGNGILQLGYYRNQSTTQTINALTGNGRVWLSDVNFTIGNGGGSGEFSGTIEDGPANDANGNPYTVVGSLTKTGAGTITLSGANTYSGATTVQQGVLAIRSADALGTAASGTRVETGAVLQIENGVTVAAEPLTLVGTGTLRSAGGDNAWNGDISLQYLPAPDHAKPTFQTESGSTLTINGHITGTGPWIKSGAGRLILTAANSHSGYADVIGGVTTLRHSQALGGADYAHVVSGATLEVDGGISVSNNLYIGNNVQSDNTPNLRSTSGDNTWAGYVRLHSGHQHGKIAVDPGSTLTISGPIQTYNDSVGSLAKLGDGLLVITGTSNTYLGPTYVDAGMLLVHGSIATSPSVTVAAGATLGGRGAVPAILGAGLVSPGASPGILTAPSVDPALGLDFAFEFTAAGSPDYSGAAASVNDVLRLTSASAPFASALDADNRVDIYLNVADVSVGDVFRGGFYTDLDADFLALIEGADFRYFLLGDGGGTHAFGGVDYYTLDEFGAVPGFAVSTAAENALFASGPAAGFVMQLTAVPEPGTLLLAALGVLLLAVFGRRRRTGPARFGRLT